jgi:hypothetical protein
MTFRIYRSGYLSEPHERVQMAGLLGYLQREFETRNEDCTIIIEPSIPSRKGGRPAKPDAIILKDNIFVLLELKAFEGDITADCSMGASWRSKEGQKMHPRGRVNPYDQSQFHRRALLNFLKARFVNRRKAPRWASANDSTMGRWMSRHVRSWVVTAEGSRPKLTGINLRENSAFNVLPVEKVANALIFLRSEEPLMSQAGLRRFLDSLKATITNRNDWHRGALIEGGYQAYGLIPEISDWMEAGEFSGIEKALKRIRELDLKPHLTQVIAIWRDRKYPSLRKEALSILIDWQYGGLGNTLDEGLRDEDLTVVKLVLEHLSQFRYAETIPALTRMLLEGPTELRVNVVNALCASDQGSACPALLTFVQSNLSNTPFRDFQYWSDRMRHSIHGVMEGSERDEILRLEKKRSSLHETCRAVIKSFGDLDCKDSIPWLKRIIEEPTFMGFETNDYWELERVHSDYFGVFANVCRSLGKVGIGDNRVTKLLVGRLSLLPGDYQDDIILALGNLGDPAAGPALLPFIDDPRGHLYGHAISAISKMRYVEAFGKLAGQYLSNPENGAGRWIGEALANIDVRQYEEVLLQGIASEVNYDRKVVFLQSLLPIASLSSVDTLFVLLEDPALSYWASWILGNLSAYPEVFNRAMVLATSNKPLLQASAIEILRDMYLGNLESLSEFEKDDTPVEIVRVVTSIYAETGSLARLLRYADHPDEEVRSNVFYTFRERQGSDHVNVFVSSESGIAENCALIVDKEGIAISLRDRVLFLPKETISRAMLTRRNEGDRHGVYFKVKRRGIDETFLVVHHSVYTRPSDELAFTLLADIRAIIDKNLGDSEAREDETRKLPLLWKNVPSNRREVGDRAR